MLVLSWPCAPAPGQPPWLPGEESEEAAAQIRPPLNFNLGTRIGGRACHYYSVREVWQRIVRRAWESGDPGLVFVDEVNRHNQTPQLGAIRATNPCGEQPLLPYEACNLGSINLAAFCDCRPPVPACEGVDWEGLTQAVEHAVRFLDNVVEVNRDTQLRKSMRRPEPPGRSALE